MWQALLGSSFFILLFSFLLLCFICLGIFCAVRYKKKHKWESSGIENSIVGIFALIISFTFLQAGNAHRDRLATIHREANYIDMLYRYSKEMPDSFYRYTQKELITFLKNQLSYEEFNDKKFFYNAKVISDSYWAKLREYKKKGNDFTYADQVNKISECFDQIQATVSLNAYSYYERTPPFVMFLLVFVSLLIGFLVGFMNGIKTKIHFLIPVIYFVMITLTMAVISDLNNPRLGLIKPSYHHLQIAYEYIKSS